IRASPASTTSQSNSMPVASRTRRVASASSGPIPSPGIRVTRWAMRPIVAAEQGRPPPAPCAFRRGPTRYHRVPSHRPSGGRVARGKTQEAAATSLLVAQGLPVPPWAVATTVEEAVAAAERFLAEGAGKVVIKAQVLVGGRGKAGGVKLAGSANEAREVAG